MAKKLECETERLRYRDLRDPYTKRFWPFRPGRDPARTPMQWDGFLPRGVHDRAGPGFPFPKTIRGSMWHQRLPIHSSLWSLYRQLLALRRMSPALSRETAM